MLDQKRIKKHIVEQLVWPNGLVGRYGCKKDFINAPLFGALVPKGKTVFLDPVTFNSYPDQWDLLETVKRHNESALDEIIEINDLSTEQQHQPPGSNPGNGSRGTFGLPPCAQKMLSEGMAQFQRVGCFRLAVQLRRLGLPKDLAVAALKTCALKNPPVNGKGVIRDEEIYSQTLSAYKGSYSGYGCESPAIEPFCETSCSVFKWRSDQTTYLSKKGNA